MKPRWKLIVLGAWIGAAGLAFLAGFAGQVSQADYPYNQSMVPLGLALTTTPCPQATPEAFWVDPVISPTDRFTQTVLVYIGQGDWAGVELGTGVFTKTGSFDLLNPAGVGIGLNPNAVHNLRA